MKGMQFFFLLCVLAAVNAFARPALAQTADFPALDFNLTAAPISLADALDAQDDGNPYDAGDWTFNLYGSGSVGVHGDHTGLYLVHAGAGVAVIDGLTINIEGVTGYAHVDSMSTFSGEDAFVLGFDALMRWHFVNEPDYSIYFEAGAGLIHSSSSVPAGGTDFNFTPQAGFGMTYQLDEHMRLLAGARWHHVSNADKDGDKRNPGYDGVMIYAGVTFPF